MRDKHMQNAHVNTMQAPPMIRSPVATAGPAGLVGPPLHCATVRSSDGQGLFQRGGGGLGGLAGLTTWCLGLLGSKG